MQNHFEFLEYLQISMYNILHVNIADSSTDRDKEIASMILRVIEIPP